jgi:transposase-like protein
MDNQRDKSKSDARCKYSIAFKKKVVHEYSKGELTQVQLRKKYGIGGKSSILRWSKIYGNLLYTEKIAIGRMAKDPQKQRIKNLERMLKEAQLKVLAYETLFEIVKEEDGIDVLKKDEAKQLVSLPKPTPEK